MEQARAWIMTTVAIYGINKMMSITDSENMEGKITVWNDEHTMRIHARFPIVSLEEWQSILTEAGFKTLKLPGNW